MSYKKCEDCKHFEIIEVINSVIIYDENGYPDGYELEPGYELNYNIYPKCIKEET